MWLPFYLDHNLAIYIVLFCGGGNFSGDDLKLIIDTAYEAKADKNALDQYFEVENCGKFRLQLADESWTKKTMLGVYDYFNTEHIKAYQVVPEEKNKLLDVPNMSDNWDNNDPIWKWLEKEWPYSVPPRSIAITNFTALKGECITELTRWKVNEWEMFAGAGPDVEEDDIRIVPFGTLLGIDLAWKLQLI